MFDRNKAVVLGYQIKPGIVKLDFIGIAKRFNCKMAPSNEFVKWS
ncbi:hypothetical protein PAMC26577_08375 [Caballeronia sordidicola]|uniref:Uncharacterized protein n=1 Tax=Caballeronia sordidicola TaxID=196367 RepID=A0A242N113_CABSO|nr:hypothetical protein PAMC26577_08375 [Caballeronia sordidicola]